MDKKCACGEARPEALLPGRPTICSACERKKHRKTTEDRHHVASKVNDPITIPVPVNDHRARLSVDQYDWPKETRENPDASPLLAAAGCIRGFADVVVYLVEKLLLKQADMLEMFDAYLAQKLGRKWWVKTELNQFAPKR
jgi:hypothetical protein